ALPAAAGALALAVLEAIDVEPEPADEIEAVGILVDANLERVAAEPPAVRARLAGHQVLAEPFLIGNGLGVRRVADPAAGKRAEPHVAFGDRSRRGRRGGRRMQREHLEQDALLG